MREVSSLADIASWTPSTDTMRIPEVRHNLRLIVDVAKGELDGLAREAKAAQDRKQWIQKEDIRLRHAIKEEADCMLNSFLRHISLLWCLQVFSDIKTPKHPSYSRRDQVSVSI